MAEQERSSPESIAHSFSKILAPSKTSSKSRSQQDVEEGVRKLRRLILIDGIPSQVVCYAISLSSHQIHHIVTLIQDSTLRPRIWKILLRVNELPASTFLEYVARGPCAVREKIRNDTFRFV